MAFTERLQILIDGNAAGAIREFQKVGAVADRELGRTEDKLERLSNRLTSVGTGLLAGGAVAVTGLKQLADSASAYGEQVSAATVTFGEEGAKQLEAFAAAAVDTANISKTEATKAANGFATFARQAGLTGTAAVKFSTDLVQLAGDLSSFRDISVEDALAALQSGLAGEGEPIRRLGGDISDVALKAEYLAITGQEVTGSLTTQQKIVAINSKLFKDFELAQGDVIRTSDSLANQTRNAQAEFENLKTELGERLTPIFATVVGGITGLLEKLGELPEPIRNTLGAIAGIGSFGAVAVGGLSIVAGQALKFRDAFTTTTTAVVDGVETQRRSLNNLGRTAGFAAGILAVIGIGFTLDSLIKSTGDAKQAVDRFKGSLNLKEEIESLNLAGASSEGLLDKLNLFENVDRFLFFDPGDGEKAVASLADVDRALGDFYKQGNLSEVQKGVDALQNALNLRTPEVNTRTIEVAQGILDDYRGKLEDADAAAGDAGESVNFLGFNLGNIRPTALDVADAFGQANGPAEEFLTTVEGLTVKTDEAKNAFQSYSDTLKANTDPFFAVIDAAGGLADAQAKVAEAYIALFTDGATTQEFLDLADAQRDAVGAAVGLESTIAALRGEVEDGNITYGSAIETLDILAQKYPALAAPGGPIDQVKKEFFFAALEAKSLGDAAPGDLPVSVNVQPVLDGLTRLSGGLFAIKAQADVAAEGVGNVFDGGTANNYDPKQVVDGFARISGGLFQIKSEAELAANAVINLFGGVFNSNRAGRQPTEEEINRQNADNINAFRELQDIRDYNGNGIIGRQFGGPVQARRPYLVGEAGVELFVPNTSGRIVPTNQLQGGGMQLTQNIYTNDPVLTAAEVVRRQRDAEFLAGV